MTTGGWITMLLSVGFVVSLFIWCISRVLTHPSNEGAVHGLEDIEKGED